LDEAAGSVSAAKTIGVPAAAGVTKPTGKVFAILAISNLIKIKRKKRERFAF
jgi:hypothetical protein